MIPVYKPYFTGREREYVGQCMDSTWISSKGEFIGHFEQMFGEFIGNPHVTSVCNGTVALHLALAALGVGVGDEVIVPTLTYVASVNMIAITGAKPVFVDSLPGTWQIDPEDVKRKISPRTKAVMIVHLYGQTCEMEEICRICSDNKLYLVEDCAEAFGAFYKGKHVGNFGDISTFSFFGNKTITTGEGGMVVAKNKSILDRAYHLKTQGVSPSREYWHDEVAFNYRMTNICAAIGTAQLEKAKEIIAKKRQIASWYKRGLENLPLAVHNEQAETVHSYWMCSIIVDNAEDRQPLRDALRLAGIETRPLFHPAHTLPHFQTREVFPVAESLAARGINLPSYPELSKEQVDFICSTIIDFFNQARGGNNLAGEVKA